MKATSSSGLAVDLNGSNLLIFRKRQRRIFEAEGAN